MVGGYCIGDVLQQYRFTGFGLRNDQTTLSFSDRCKQIHHTGRKVALFSGEVKTLVGKKGSEVFKRYTVAHKVRIAAIDFIHFYKREVFFSFARRTYFTDNRVTGFKAE